MFEWTHVLLDKRNALQLYKSNGNQRSISTEYTFYYNTPSKPLKITTNYLHSYADQMIADQASKERRERLERALEWMRNKEGRNEQIHIENVRLYLGRVMSQREKELYCKLSQRPEGSKCSYIYIY